MARLSPRSPSRRRADINGYEEHTDAASERVLFANDQRVLEELVNSRPQSIEAAVKYLRDHGIEMQYEVVESGSEFSTAELEFLCLCGGAYETTFKRMRRGKEVSV